jgi:RNA polymerase sigma-70 factor (ECF subfamily)
MQQEQEFIRTIKRHEGVIYKITHVYAQDNEDQKDLYQEIVYQLWKSFGSFKGNSKVSTWMYRVALNTSITHQKKKRVTGIPLDFELLQISDEHDAVMDEKLQRMYAQIKQLNVVEKGIILLYLEGKSYDDISEITGFTITNVGTRLGRIKQKLKNNLNS